jgi:two-component system, NtrC family, nitrogen regulation sensor histidine kinase NtrY
MRWHALPNQTMLGITARAALIGALACLMIHLVATTRLYATISVLGGLVALIAADLFRYTMRLERSVEQLAQSFYADAPDLPLLLSLTAPRHIEKAVANWRARRREQQRLLEHAHALLDTVAAALFVIDSRGRIAWLNRSARRLAGRVVEHIGEITGVGQVAAAAICDISVGTRAIVRFAAGQQMHVSCSQFAAPGESPQRLIAIQSIAGELDAVEQKAWNDMAQVLTHEMMNSLTPIASLSESLEQLFRREHASSGAETEIAAALEAIKRRSLGLISFVERYRAVADLPVPICRPVVMEVLLDGVERLMIASMRGRNIQFTRIPCPPSLSLHADPELLEQALINLLQNAVDAASEAREPQVELRCACEEQQFTIEVSDNGLGIPSTVGDQIFVPFFSTKQGGVGIGLSIARYVASAHGGTLQVRSNVPTGSSFRMSLPQRFDEEGTSTR